ncbi:MAG: hypothetical protein WDO13_12080 [Verrucomicrobiota bacterium]
MKISMKIILSGAYVLAFAGVPFLGMAEPGSAPPTPPFVAAVPENARWAITVSRPSSNGAASAAPASAGAAGKSTTQLQEIRVVKTGATKHDTLVYSDGGTDEVWYLGTKALMSDTFVKTNIYLTTFSSHDFTGVGDPVRSLGFTGMDWLQSKFFDKIVTYQNVSCYHYHFSGRSAAAEAWVNVKNKLPVAYQINGALYVYSFGEPPTTPLVFPPAYQAVWDKSLEIKKHQEQYARDLGKH